MTQCNNVDRITKELCENEFVRYGVRTVKKSLQDKFKAKGWRIAVAGEKETIKKDLDGFGYKMSKDDLFIPLDNTYLSPPYPDLDKLNKEFNKINTPLEGKHRLVLYKPKLQVRNKKGKYLNQKKALLKSGYGAGLNCYGLPKIFFGIFSGGFQSGL